MKCPLCGKDVILQQKQVGTTENGEPIMNQYAICKDCKKQWNLDKQRAKKMAAKKAVEDVKQAESTRSDEEKKAVKKARPVNGEDAPKKRRPVNEDGTPKKRRPADGEATPKKRRPVNEDGTPKKRRPTDGEATPKKRRPVNEDGTPKKRRPADGEATPKKRRPIEEEATLSSASETTEEQKYGNIPPQHVRAQRERAMRKGYEDMLSTDPSYRSNKISNTDDLSDLKQRTMNAYDDINDDDWDDEYEPKARFRVLRVLLGILSIGGFGFCVYSALMAGLDGILSGDTASAGMTYAILAACMFVSALLLLIMQKSNSVFAFILPMLLYLGGGVYAFMKRQGEANLLYCAIAGLVLAVIFLILTIASRGDSDDYDSSDDYDDPFEDDFDN